MRHSMGCWAMLWALAWAAPSAHGQAAAGGADAARFQYDELTLMLHSGQSAPGADSFEQHYTETLDYFAHAASVAPLQADAAAKREAALKALNEPGAGDRVAGMLMGQITDLVSRANPIAGMVFDMVAGAARGHRRDDGALAEQAASDAEAQLLDEQGWRPQLRRIAVWDHWLRIENLDDGSAVIYKPDVGEYVVLDTRQKTWIRLDAPPVDPDAQRIGADPQRCRYELHRETRTLGTRTIDGHVAEGYRSVERNPSGGGATSVLEDTSWISSQRIPADILEVMHGFANCPPDSPAARSDRVPDDRVTLYQSVLWHDEGNRGVALPQDVRAPGLGLVYFEQHLRSLDERDRDALFSAPTDYRELR